MLSNCIKEQIDYLPNTLEVLIFDQILFNLTKLQMILKKL